ncbi:universal stress protein [Haloferax volcanii]|uniref:UspA domain protein n=3 Tax=Haloferax volcanii TaxID=2246 RepID=D4GSV6_HALVD|nr:universal stress protein [Haloferax volcanii]ADE04963.1 UspA domain protein [Haloferax volcanii DS2]ELY34747.1 UspA domain-containing protein [Haloferax volcanii DS2]MBS8120049.1 universal stress protein [Haloferax volcanii]MBS8125087.1 universal stress protein [Haloferax volcanii]MBS8128584.1 universal stress protein [Haloferax volcanii]
MYDRILVPVDGSGPADEALDRALDLAAATDATLYALYVVDERALHATQLDAGGLVRAYEAEGERIVSEAVEAAEADGTEVVTAVEHGSPHRAILRYAEEVDADLIVMGTHGRRSIERYLLGSVTERVLRLVDVPVLSVRSEDSPVERE